MATATAWEAAARARVMAEICILADGICGGMSCGTGVGYEDVTRGENELMLSSVART
jgi:hypothetical protein